MVLLNIQPDLVLPPVLSLMFYQPHNYINFFIPKQGTQFAFELHLSFHRRGIVVFHLGNGWGEGGEEEDGVDVNFTDGLHCGHCGIRGKIIFYFWKHVCNKNCLLEVVRSVWTYFFYKDDTPTYIFKMSFCLNLSTLILEFWYFHSLSLPCDTVSLNLKVLKIFALLPDWRLLVDCIPSSGWNIYQHLSMEHCAYHITVNGEFNFFEESKMWCLADFKLCVGRTLNTSSKEDK